MRRPSVGPRIMNGILLILKKMTINIKNSYVPSWWSDDDLHDVRSALKYLGKLYDWYMEFGGEHEEHQPVVAESDGHPASGGDSGVSPDGLDNDQQAEGVGGEGSDYREEAE